MPLLGVLGEGYEVIFLSKIHQLVADDAILTSLSYQTAPGGVCILSCDWLLVFIAWSVIGQDKYTQLQSASQAFHAVALQKPKHQEK